MIRFWNWVRNEDSGERTLYLDGVIAGESWYGDEVTPAAFKAELCAENGPVKVHINSIGGDCIAASRIYTMLKEYPDEVTVQIDGVAASAASVVAMAGTRVCMSPTALMMVHNPWTNACGDSEDMRKAVELLDEVKESIINAYQLKTGMDRVELSQLMDAETWLNARKAKELGFCDEVLFEDEETEKVSFSFSSKVAEVKLMNLIRTCSAAESSNDKTFESSCSLSSEKTSDSVDDEDQTENSNHSPTPNDDRVNVRGSDTRLEHLRY